ncbi:thiamine phosphate synthase [Vibrio aerogenes]|nr:thiamine phosphate synthase [Vibrio aerogenes]
MRYSVLVDIFSQALPEKISEQWYLSEQDETRSLISRVQMSQPHDVFKANHLSWFLALLILDFPLEDVFILARAALNVSRGTWPKEIQFFPKMNSTDLPTSVYIPQTPFPAVDASLFDLYPVVNEFKWVKNLLAQSVKTVQLRVKEAIGGDLITQIRKSIELGRTYDAQVFINDYWQIAIDENAYGIHLGQEDLLDADLEWIHAAGIRLGISTHSYFEILIAEMIKPSYIALGHIFPTSTKQMPSKPQGLVRLNLYQQLIHSLCDHEKRSIPTVAIGGIDLSNLPLVMAQGVDCVAVVRAITQANDVIDAVSQFKTGIHQAKETYDAVNDRC